MNGAQSAPSHLKRVDARVPPAHQRLHHGQDVPTKSAPPSWRGGPQGGLVQLHPRLLYELPNLFDSAPERVLHAYREGTMLLSWGRFDSDETIYKSLPATWVFRRCFRF